MICEDLWQPDSVVSKYAARQIQEMHQVEAWRSLLPQEALQNRTGRPLSEQDVRYVLLRAKPCSAVCQMHSQATRAAPSEQPAHDLILRRASRNCCVVLGRG